MRGWVPGICGRSLVARLSKRADHLGEDLFMYEKTLNAAGLYRRESAG
jgi:hypothetical protein